MIQGLIDHRLLTSSGAMTKSKISLGRLITRFTAAFCLIGSYSITAGPQAVIAQDFTQILNSPNAVERIDALGEGARQSLMLEVPSQLRANPERIAEIMCRISPWTTGDEQGDALIQSLFWDLMATEPHAETQAYRWLDCGAINRTGYYRSAVLDPMLDLRSSYCSVTNVDVSFNPQLSDIIGNIQTFDQLVQTGLAETGTQAASYFPLRNGIRLANLAAAQAVQVWPTDPAEGRTILNDAATHLRTLADEIEFTRTRNSWRWYYELRFHEALYAWLGGTGSLDDVEALADIPPVLEDPTFASLRQTDIFSVIPDYESDYVDPIFIERLLPGAQQGNPASECDQWHRRLFSPTALVDAVVACADQQNDLFAFDSCMAGLEVSDWTLNYQTAPEGASAAAIQHSHKSISDFVEATIEVLQNRLAAAQSTDDTKGVTEPNDGQTANNEVILTLDLDDLQERLLVQTGLDPTTGRLVFYAAPTEGAERSTFTTTERTELTRAFSAARNRLAIRWRPQFLRPRTY